MDEMDYAWEHAESFNKAALDAARIRHTPAAPSTGICVSCHLPIEAERLEASPTARLCHDCAADQEDQRKRQRRCGP